MIKYPMPLPMSKLEYAKAYILNQPYTGVVPPEEALKCGTIFPFLLQAYMPQLKKALKEGKR